MADVSEEDSLFLLPCSICSRTFRSEVLQRHESVCEKTQAKKRKVFDSFRCRVQGTDLEEFLGPPPLPGQPAKLPVRPKSPEKSKPKPSKLPKWKQTHEALIATVRAARSSDAPVSATPLIKATCEQCPTCGRNFGHRAYDRHVEFCREMMSRKAREPVKYNPAQERQDARVKYQAPLTIKRNFKSASLPSTVGLKRNMSTAPLQRQASTTTNETTPTLQRQATATIKPLRAATSVSTQPSSALNRAGSIRIRGVSPTKLPNTLKRNASPTKRSTISSKSNKKEKDVANETKILDGGSQTYGKTTLEAIMATAQKQMRELMSWSSDSDIAEPSKPSNVTTTLPPLSSPKPSSPLVPSPTSAFTPFTPSNRSDRWNITDFIDENENCQNNDWSNDDANNFYKMLTSTPKTKPTPAPRTPAAARKSLGGQEDTRRLRDFEGDGMHLSRISSGEEDKRWQDMLASSDEDGNLLSRKSIGDVHNRPLSRTSIGENDVRRLSIKSIGEDNNRLLTEEDNRRRSNVEDGEKRVSRTSSGGEDRRRLSRKSDAEEDLKQMSIKSISEEDNRLLIKEDNIHVSRTGRVEDGKKQVSRTPEEDRRRLSPTSVAEEDLKRMSFNSIGEEDDRPGIEEDIRHVSRTGRVEDEKKRVSRTVSGEEDRRRLSRTSISSQPSDSILAEEGVLWAKLDMMQQPLTRSRKKTFARSKSVVEDRNRMLFLQTYEVTSSDEELDIKRFPNANVQSYYNRPSSPLEQEIIRGGGDSAYSSLNRRSPRPQEELLPKRKVSKFCHECGSQYPVALAKFCCECGVKRLLI